MTSLYKATYSPEDNKLRIYTDHYPAEKIEQKLISAGFIHAPMQKLFASKWTPSKADLCIELAGEITPEIISVTERAEIKALRLDDDQAKNVRRHAKHKISSSLRKRRIKTFYVALRKQQCL